MMCLIEGLKKIIVYVIGILDFKFKFFDIYELDILCLKI